MKITTKNLKETYDLAIEFVNRIQSPVSPRASGALVFGLSGDLGSGKTSFVQGVAKVLGVEEHVTSPTFVILKKYSIPNPSNLKPITSLIHIDAYRLKDEHDLVSIGWEEITKDQENLILIEWPENVGLKNIPEIKFKFIDETTREISFPENIEIE